MDPDPYASGPVQNNKKHVHLPNLLKVAVHEIRMLCQVFNADGINILDLPFETRAGV